MPRLRVADPVLRRPLSDDPCHGFDCVTQQIYGRVIPPADKDTPTMGGFVANAAAYKHNISNPMSMFTPETAPIIA